VTVSCATLPDKLVARLREDVAAWGRRAEAARELHWWAKERDLPGIAAVLVNEAEDLPVVPVGAAQLFEPVELDGKNPVVKALAGVHGGVADAADQTAGAVGRRRRLLRVLLALVFFPLALLAGVLDMGPLHTVWHGVVYAVLVLVVWLAVFVVWRLQTGRWVIFPGGVVVRRFAAAPWRTGAMRYCPQDTVLIVERVAWHWEAYLYRGYRPASRELTDVECRALLAAWQSPVPTPPLDETLGRG